MEYGILDPIDFHVQTSSLAWQLHISPESYLYSEFLQIVSEAFMVAHPRAAYRIGYVEGKGHNGVWINGVRFTSRVLRINLGQVQRVFLYLATCGEELDTWSKEMPDLLYQYWADAIKEVMLKFAHEALMEQICEKYQLSGISSISPGSLPDWPLSQQRLLFDVLNGLDEQIGVKLTDNLLMLPEKSISGIHFPSENHFESCQLCPRENCIGRRALYDQDLYEKKFA